MSLAARSKGGFSGSFEGTARWPGLGLAEARMWSRSNIEGETFAGFEKVLVVRQRRQMYNTPSEIPKTPKYIINKKYLIPGKEAVTTRATAPNAERVTKNPAQPGDK